MKNFNITNIGDIENAIRMASDHLEYSMTTWWRGQSIDKPLIPSVFRRDDYLTAEHGLLARFVLRAPSRYTQCPANDDWAGWLFLMQHYGLHTRLLDWTESILIATYFAVSQDPDETGIIFGISPFLLNKIQFGTVSIFDGHDKKISNLFEGAFKKFNVDKIAAVNPRENNIRMLLQQSMFTIHGSPKSIEDQLEDDSCYVKFYIQPKDKLAIQQTLDNLGINEKSIYPELEHLTKYLNNLKL